MSRPEAPDPNQGWERSAFQAMAILLVLFGALEALGGGLAFFGLRLDGAGGLIGHGILTIFAGMGLMRGWPFAPTFLRVSCWLAIAMLGILLAVLSLAFRRLTLVEDLLSLVAIAFYLVLNGFALYLEKACRPA